ncbi:MAG: hypothetical protein K9M49_05365 [Candidatus Marinimicrobia bacterium]|nr:hypothetical protein [Candidatus Neomarinimicrobiota bacterium]MCF7850434.1 hypothetical protein [Candidatus Neomarinimicrobiota bacterium]MCF7904566.1 hypothetical protein [Candidatus Neomarinimicrobiota bacterium]
MNDGTNTQRKDPVEHSHPDLEFHVRGLITDQYGLHLPLYTLENGKFRIAYHELQNLAHQMQADDPETSFTARELHGMGLLMLISHKVVRLYKNQVNPRYISDLHDHLSTELQEDQLQDMLARFVEALPTAVYRASETTPETFLNSEIGKVKTSDLVTEELLIHLLARANPALQTCETIFKDEFHERVRQPEKLLGIIQAMTDAGEGFGAEGKNLLELLMEPILAAPDSIYDQLKWIQQNWASFLGTHISDLLRGLDHFEEERKIRAGGPGEITGPSYSGDLMDGEYYSADSEWMPRVVMIARNSLVWLDQLSKKYKQEIKTLDAIPDAELDLLKDQGFTVLWLIGLWNRSSISKQIKHWCGNPDAESSAYSLKEYKIDPILGGEAALENLRKRAWERGIRLASDMVPNHTGLDANWLKDHPDWYISADHPPFPSYTFDGGDLSEDPELSIHLEDHYYTRSDAAVVFKYYDHRNGQTRYVYHGNDGTSMPWNDTAQLNYLNPELREQVIQVILDVARQFKVIRFDAAMTLAKRHIQRLWFPEPGSGGDIPSRASYSMSGADFNAAIPAEFWREVVDRVAKEVPDTLLLAEAFWMMEGYFVRTLGMHRVYNSAFMNMLKMEENAKFFGMIASTIEFDPRILQRYVNFLSNPDEDTAIAQFGKGDKYFGATILMITLPGMPMFAHAQIEGFEEKYGMEYRRAYWDESPDQDLVHRHEAQIFPLMKQRHLFADAQNFRLFPMTNADGNRIDSVFAYTNRFENERSLVVVNNSYTSQAGWIKGSTLFNRAPAADQADMITEDLNAVLIEPGTSRQFVIFHEQISNQWFVREIQQLREQGLYLELSGYQSQVYLNFQYVDDSLDFHWTEVAQRLNGAGVQDFAHVHKLIELIPVHRLLKHLLNRIQEKEDPDVLGEMLTTFSPVFEAMLDMLGISLLLEEIQDYSKRFEQRYTELSAIRFLRDDDTGSLNTIMASVLALTAQVHRAVPTQQGSVVDEFQLLEPLRDTLSVEELQRLDVLPILELTDQLLAHEPETLAGLCQDLMRTAEAQTFLLMNDADGVTWFKQERMEQLIAVLDPFLKIQRPEWKLKVLRSALKASDYQLDKFLGSL